MDNNERMTAWCRMWSEDPTLARDLMTDDCRQWSAQTEGLDGVVGPEAAIGMMNAYRDLHINVFTPRVLVDGGETFAYLWDVMTPDGTARTGLDVNILRDGAVAENWTFVADRRDERTIPDGAATDRGVLIALAESAVTGHGGRVHRVPIVDPERGYVTVMWTAPNADGVHAGAVDMLAVRDGEVVQSWSLPGRRPFPC